MKASLETLLFGDDYLTGTVSEHVHPDVELSMPLFSIFASSNPIYWVVVGLA
jgi:hypothetical protein